jgi:methionine-rich copper-binding protein CopC
MSYARATAALAGLVILLVLNPAPAQAHNQLIGSNPAANAELAESPAEVRLDFDQPVDPQLAEVTITGPDGSTWAVGAPTVVDSSVRATATPLGPAGAYEVGYRIMSADGHPVSGSVRFTLLTAGPGTSSAPVAAQAAVASTGSTSDSGGAPIWPWLVGGVVLLVAGLFTARRVAR